MANTNIGKGEVFRLKDCSEAHADFANQFHGIFTSQLAVYLRDTGKCSATIVDDKDPLFKQKFESLRSLLERKYVAQVKATSKCDSLAAAFKKANRLPNITVFFKKNDRQISKWALENIFGSSVPHLGSQTDAGVAVTLFQEFLLMHDMLIPNLVLSESDKMQIMMRSIAISKLLLAQTLSELGLPNDEQSRFTAMSNPKVKAHFDNLVTFPTFRQHQINEIPQARMYQEEILESFRKDLKPELKKTKQMLIGTSVAAGILLISTVYLISKKSKKSKTTRHTQVKRFEQEPRFEQDVDTLVDYPVYSRSSRTDESPVHESDPEFYARTDWKPVKY